MKQYFFAGGIYYKDDTHKETYFGAVRPTNGLPYITKNKNGLSLTSHHSSLYLLSDDFTEAILVDYRNGGVRKSPYNVKLPQKLVEKIKQSVANKNFYY
jgi:hypothetical protein